MDIKQHDLIELTTSIWESLVGLELSPLDGALIPADSECLMTACVHITGATPRIVTVECVDALARRIAESMFRISPSEVSDSDASDSLGEIANVIAGNVKAVSSVQCDLSLPVVVRGNRFAALAIAGEIRSEAALTSGGHVLAVRVLEPAEDCRTTGV